MKIAIPATNNKLSMHFGHCETFEIFEVDMDKKTVTSKESHTPPPHEPGVLPAWLAEMDVHLIVAGGMGQRAVSLFNEKDIKVVVGAPSDVTENVIEKYMNGTIEYGSNICDH